MRKTTCIISCPISTYSGYGGRARDIVKALIKDYPEWDIKILPQRWGQTRMGYLEDHNEQDLLNRCIYDVKEKPNIWIQITVPNEFQSVGDYNIGITAAMETTLCDVSWVLGCNRMDLVLTSSEHGRRSLLGSSYVDNRTGQNISINVPIEVLFEGMDLTKYRPDPKKTEILKDLKNSWNFLCVGHWLPGDFRQDRKNIGLTIKAFLETFKDRKGQVPGLILKISKGTTSISDQKDMLDRIYSIKSSVQHKESLPNIYLLHGDLTDSEMNELYNDPRVKAMVSLTKGEGYGRPLAEFAAIGKPIIASGWSGHMDFLTKDSSILIGGSIEKVHPSAVIEHMILPEASWFSPADEQINMGFNEMFNNYDKWAKRALKYKDTIASEFSMNMMEVSLKNILDRNITLTEQVSLVL